MDLENENDVHLQVVKELPISLEAHRNQKVREEFVKTYEAYLKLLDYAELINEIEHLLAKIRSQNLEQKMTIKAEILLDELSSRAKKDSPTLSAEFSKMREILSDKFKNTLNFFPTNI